ncbi:Integrase core domain-containing protein [Arcanobacterium phocae]|uniref:Integrase core domain-containing protein n=1 Tax=Arcanobacterium phocae TaxID=131112 RepID=A0A1H2LC30_9ACTO|nr:integrase core domain-containing protein [Arcanobacterium phocae]SDU78610.1 Integrase core domain-containing protein [Arcanobacterium phocae]
MVVINNELIHPRTWQDVLEVEIATFEWVSWWNKTRLHQALDYRTPLEVENDYWYTVNTTQKIQTPTRAKA